MRKLEPLIRKWAHQEHRRELAQHRRVDFEDVHSVLVVNLLRALDEIDASKLKASAINYLYMSTISRARRELSVTNSDVRFTPKFLQECRRVTAIIDDLSLQLGRTPTDEEIIERSKQPTPGIKLGSRERNVTMTTIAPLTQRFLDAYRQHAPTLHVVGSIDESDVFGSFAAVSDPYEDEASETLLARVCVRAGNLAGMSHDVVAVICAAEGIPPFGETDPTTVRVVFGVSPARLRALVGAWQGMCRTPHSPFHEALWSVRTELGPEDTLRQMLTRLGDFDPAQAVPAPIALLEG